MKTKISLALSAASLLLPAFASAQIWTSTTQIFGLGCTIVNLLFGILIFLTIFFVILAAFKYLTASGDPEKVKAASQDLLYAAVAIVVGLLAKGIPLIVGSLVGGTAAIQASIFAGC